MDSTPVPSGGRARSETETECGGGGGGGGSSDGDQGSECKRQRIAVPLLGLDGRTTIFEMDLGPPPSPSEAAAPEAATAGVAAGSVFPATGESQLAPLSNQLASSTEALEETPFLVLNDG
eukprot:SAG11_NODE_583_length_8352_cov_3.465649_8_plen_119_part_01